MLIGFCFVLHYEELKDINRNHYRHSYMLNPKTLQWVTFLPKQSHMPLIFRDSFYFYNFIKMFHKMCILGCEGDMAVTSVIPLIARVDLTIERPVSLSSHEICAFFLELHIWWKRTFPSRGGPVSRSICRRTWGRQASRTPDISK